MKKTFLTGILIIASAILISSCNNAPKKDQVADADQHEATTEHEKDCDHVHWSHHGEEEGPENWKNLCDGFMSCGGEAQSPINIITTNTTSENNLTAIEFNYTSSKVDIINNGHTVQFNTSGENAVMINDKEYKLLQFHYHTHSEHTIDGNYYPIEVHFVHKHSDEDYAVLGVMFEEGEENELFAKYLNHFPTTKGEFASEDMIELKSLFPSDLSYYYYSGSLTTPPCSEVVNWYVLKSPLKASKEQIEKFAEILNDNYRPVMPLNDREVLSYN